jgi:hypothetical protein
MKWMLIVMVFGAAPVKTDLLFDSLDDCLKAEESARGEYARAYNIWIKCQTLALRQFCCIGLLKLRRWRCADPAPRMFSKCPML